MVSAFYRADGEVEPSPHLQILFVRIIFVKSIIQFVIVGQNDFGKLETVFVTDIQYPWRPSSGNAVKFNAHTPIWCKYTE